MLVMREDFFMEFFFLDDGCLWKVACSKKEVVVVEMILWVV